MNRGSRTCSGDPGGSRRRAARGRSGPGPRSRCIGSEPAGASARGPARPIEPGPVRPGPPARLGGVRDGLVHQVAHLRPGGRRALAGDHAVLDVHEVRRAGHAVVGPGRRRTGRPRAAARPGRAAATTLSSCGPLVTTTRRPSPGTSGRAGRQLVPERLAHRAAAGQERHAACGVRRPATGMVTSSPSSVVPTTAAAAHARRAGSPACMPRLEVDRHRPGGRPGGARRWPRRLARTARGRGPRRARAARAGSARGCAAARARAAASSAMATPSATTTASTGFNLSAGRCAERTALGVTVGRHRDDQVAQPAPTQHRERRAPTTASARLVRRGRPRRGRRRVDRHRDAGRRQQRRDEQVGAGGRGVGAAEAAARAEHAAAGQGERDEAGERQVGQRRPVRRSAVRAHQRRRRPRATSAAAATRTSAAAAPAARPSAARAPAASGRAASAAPASTSSAGGRQERRRRRRSPCASTLHAIVR